MMSAEGFVYYALQRYGKEFGRFKEGIDITLATAAMLLSLLCTRRIEGVREGTLAAALATGWIVTFLNRRVFTRTALGRILPTRLSRAAPDRS